MSSPASHYSTTSGGSAYTGGRPSSGGVQLSQWASTTDRTERFHATGQRTGRSVMSTADTILAFDKRFKSSS
ncbi:hypothetical protein FALBO_1268 [Fusarium albosuccineum]|uniref:Uncharacterized protein n=2 Tax=Fusarium decemcellulare species complex TaxID=1329916 RepID=A0A8H4PDR5_9HYPO|nr:hypothetical protein FALBO_1268 [Fusarium albosuccineum]KAJ3531072.1 hypothetical protein NM208_g9042 [Fusarium decemcellulare]